MVTLLAADQKSVQSQWMHDDQGPCDFTKADLLAALQAADVWYSNNQVSYNLALPLAFRTSATALQKTRLLFYVIQKRFLTGTN